MLDRLMEYQDRIEALLRRAEANILSDRPDIALMGKIRWELTRTLREYQLFKHTQIFDRLIPDGGARAHTAQRMKNECLAVGEAYKQHVARWGVAGVGDPGYASAGETLSRKLRTHLQRERLGAKALLDAGEPGRHTRAG